MSKPVHKNPLLVWIILGAVVALFLILMAIFFPKPDATPRITTNIPAPAVTGPGMRHQPSPATQPELEAGEKLTPELQELLEDAGDGPNAHSLLPSPPPGAAGGSSQPAGMVEVSITVVGPPAKEEIADLIEDRGGTVLRGRGEPGTALRARVTAEVLEELANQPEVIFMERYQPPKLLNDRAAAIIAAAPVTIPEFITPAGLTGRGQVVGLADSGLDAGSTTDIHPDLASTPGEKPKVIMLKSWAGRAVADDPNGHGTHMAATIAGSGVASNGQFRGLAPGASLYIQGILNTAGELDPPADLTALFTPAYAANVRIHVDGWGSQANAYLAASSQIDAFIREHPDFLVILGAGNSGPDDHSLTTEANSKNTLVVGAVQSSRPTLGPPASDPNQLASFSSRGPTNDGRLKPEVVAPGTAIVSAASRLIQSNFTPNSRYTWMQGTSMAAAVAGGTTALVREYLEQNEAQWRPKTASHTGAGQAAFPSAALLKAVLINGAQLLPGLPRAAQGFGRLDAAGTLLALREQTFHLDDNATGVATGETRQYTYQVTSSATPLKVTLAWTDPPARPGAGRTLVNDLDLVVTAPDGRQYLGNDWGGKGQTDRINNVEQVYLPDPLPGIYTVRVRGTAIATSTVRGSGEPRQDYALAYGQPLAQDVVVASNGRVIETAGGKTFSLAGKQTKIALNGRLVPAGDQDVPPGTQVYAGSPNLYLVAQTWQAGAMQPVRLDTRWALVEANPRLRQGGYYLEPAALDKVRLNGETAAVADIPPGADLTASLNPITQALWMVAATYQEKSGVLSVLNQEKGELELVGEPQPYQLSPAAAVSFADQVVDISPVDRPFGRGTTDGLDQLLPGMPVRLTISPTTGEVNYLAARRYLIIGTLAAVDLARGTVTLDTGRTYPVLPGNYITRNGVPARLTDLSPGNHITAVVLPDTQEAAMLNARTEVDYGQVVYVDAEGRQLLLQSGLGGQVKTLQLSARVRVQRWGLETDLNAVSAGNWARLTLDPETDTVQQIDVAEVAKPVTATVASYDATQHRLTTATGDTYYLAPYTIITKDGHPSVPESLVAGEEITLTPLLGPDGSTQVAVAVAATTRGGIAPPALHLALRSGPEEIILSGTTTADLLYLVIPGSGQYYPLATDAAGYFEKRFSTGKQQEVQLIAIDSATGGVNYQALSLPAATVPPTLSDIAGHRAAREIEELVRQGIVAGYPDGTFRPEKPVNRVELVAMLTRALGWAQLPVPAGSRLPFTDATAIPEWARGLLLTAWERGLVAGYGDGSFRPLERVTREETAALIGRALRLAPALPGSATIDNPPVEDLYTDAAAIAPWARNAVADASAHGLLVGRGDRQFKPQTPLTRAEAAVVIYRLQQKISQNF